MRVAPDDQPGATTEQKRTRPVTIVTPQPVKFCSCPRQGDLWLCRARPNFERTEDGQLIFERGKPLPAPPPDDTIPFEQTAAGEACELGGYVHTTGTDYWRGDPC